MREARALRSVQKRKRVLSVLDAALERGEEIQLATLAKRADVSRTFIYENENLRAEIQLRIGQAQERAAAGLITGARVTAMSLRAELENYKAMNREHRRENDALKLRLSELVGAQVLKGDFPAVANSIADEHQQAAITELEAENFKLQERVSVLEDELEGVREVNRKLMARVNREESAVGGV
jgi:hypothetical protein